MVYLTLLVTIQLEKFELDLDASEGRWQQWSAAIEPAGSANTPLAAVGTCGLACSDLPLLSCWALVRPAERGLDAGWRCFVLLLLWLGWLELSVTWLAAETAETWAPAKSSFLGLSLGAAPQVKLFALPLSGCAGEVTGARCQLLCLGWRGSFMAYNSCEGSCTGMAAWVCFCTGKSGSEVEWSCSSQLADCDNLCVPFKCTITAQSPHSAAVCKFGRRELANTL